MPPLHPHHSLSLSLWGPAQYLPDGDVDLALDTRCANTLCVLTEGPGVVPWTGAGVGPGTLAAVEAEAFAVGRAGETCQGPVVLLGGPPRTLHALHTHPSPPGVHHVTVKTHHVGLATIVTTTDWWLFKTISFLV